MCTNRIRYEGKKRDLACDGENHKESVPLLEESGTLWREKHGGKEVKDCSEK
jgi:hypothetical protein